MKKLFETRFQRPSLPSTDELISALDNGLRVLSGAAQAVRPMPMPMPMPMPLTPPASPAGSDDESLCRTIAPEPAAGALSSSEASQRLSGALMRVNHVGEVCAQALYQAQALTARTPALKRQLLQAAREEEDHLAWTQARLDALGDRASLLNPVWYAGAFGLGLVAGTLGDRVSLSFLLETERQVETHLASHLDRLPIEDLASRAVVTRMKEDEAAHGHSAQDAGAQDLPAPVRAAMRGAARIMTTVAHRI